MASPDLLASLPLFRGLTPDERAAILRLIRPRNVARGEPLVTEGDPSEALYIVLHGSFEASRGEAPLPVARIHAGQVIGEIGFFGGTPRTATVRATRDATVLELDRRGYAQLVRESPATVPALLAVVARRLNDTGARLAEPAPRGSMRTVAIVHGGEEPIPPEFHERLRAALAAAGARAIDRPLIESLHAGRSPDSGEVTHWLSALEWDDRLLVYLADRELTDWTRRCVRQADTVVVVTRGAAPITLNPTEAFVAEVHGPGSRRLVRVHDQRVPVVSGTPAWLDRMEVAMHHHVALTDDEDFRALVRFLTGRAVGFAAGGGGGFAPAHAGIYRAFTERGVRFDLLVGTSVGAAVLAGFAMLFDGDRLDRVIHQVFVASRTFRRLTWPKYSLLDHKRFEAALAEAYGATTLIEDCWRPFLAVATNLSTQRRELIRSGSLWRAVRASCALPALLPPVYTAEGMMLVDGGMMDNIPLAPLQELKSGPNVVVHFGQIGEQRFYCRNDEIPGRGRLIASLLNPFARRRLPQAPGAANVLMRSLFAQRYEVPVGPRDVVMRPPRFPGAAFLHFDHHTRVYHASHLWAGETIDARAAAGDAALREILATSPPPPLPSAPPPPMEVTVPMPHA